MNRRASSFLVAGAMALSAWLLVARLGAPVAFDGKNFYLPMAREVLDHGWAYLSNPDSVHYAPLAFLWPALLGAREALVREANIALYCMAIAFAYVALRKAHSERAGVIAAVLLAICPTVRPFVADVLTESPFIFLTAAWALCVAQVEAGGKRGWAIAGGIALAAAALVRPAVMYFAPLAFAYFAWKRRWPLATLHGIATAGIALWVIRNAIVFGFPAISAGAGGALYFGVNPLVDGFDPPYYGMGFDSGLAQDSLNHLSIHSDRVLRGIGTLELLDTPLSYLLPMFVHKAFAFVFVSSMEPSGEPIALLRGWRVAVAVLAVAGYGWNRRSALATMLAAFVAYMVIVHVPLLYTHRYSVALDLPLALLAALGIAEAWRSASRAAAALVAVGLALGAGLANATPGPGSPMPERIPNEVVWLGRVDGSTVVFRGDPIDVQVSRTAGTPPWDLSMLQFDLAVDPTRPGACSAVTVRFKRPSEPAFVPWRAVRVPLDRSPGPHRYTVGSTVPLILDGSGTLRFQLDCTDAARVSMGTIAVITPKREVYYRDLYRARMAGKGE